MKALALAGVLLAGACAPAQTPASAAHPTIVSLNPCTDAVLAEVADPMQVLALSHYSHDPRATSMDLATARRFRVTGGTVEEVLALDPDVVVAGTFLPPATQSAFARLGIRVETFGIASSVADSEAQVRRLAHIAGHPRRGDVLASRIARAVAEAAPPPGAEPVEAVMWQAGGIVPGGDALVSELMRDAGFASQTAARGMRQADYLALEQVIADPPEVLLVAGNDRAQAHPALDAVPDMRIAEYNSALLYCGGPTIPKALARLESVRLGVSPRAGGDPRKSPDDQAARDPRLRGGSSR